MRTLCSAVLFFEAIILGLAIPVALALSDADGGMVVAVGSALVVLCFVAIGLLARSSAGGGRAGGDGSSGGSSGGSSSGGSSGAASVAVGLVIGWCVQVAAVLAGFVVPTMFFLGGVFGVLWYFAIRLGRKGDAATAAHRASLEQDPPPTSR